jgi:hypothetical protein
MTRKQCVADKQPVWTLDLLRLCGGGEREHQCAGEEPE